MALWFLNFSTWDGVAGIYVEDLFVWPRFRRRGLARGLLSTLARECVDNRYTRLAWSVLNWNSDAIALYDRIGGQPQHEWLSIDCQDRGWLRWPHHADHARRPSGSKAD
ncbi:N-acetyltransferase Ats1 [Mycobacterium tuberculosis]|nr:N-acetyltransferase Ats1 [Mycobacterium tuberculosis]